MFKKVTGRKSLKVMSCRFPGFVTFIAVFTMPVCATLAYVLIHALFELIVPWKLSSECYLIDLHSYGRMVLFPVVVLFR